MALSRRAALQGGVAGALLAAAGGALGWFRWGYALAPGEAAIGLSVKELCVARALVEVAMPADGDLPSGVSLGVHQRIDEEVWAAPPAIAEELRSALQLLEHIPPAYGVWGRFSSLDLADREAVLSAMLASEKRIPVAAARALLQLAALFTYGHEASYAGIGYSGPLVATPRPPASAVRYQELLTLARGAR